MSIPVPATRLAEQLEGRSFAYVVTANEGRSHVIAVVPHVDADRIVVRAIGRTTRADVQDNERITIVWPPSTVVGEHSAYSLIADGRARVVGDGIEIVVERAVLHRPAA